MSMHADSKVMIAIPMPEYPRVQSSQPQTPSMLWL
jgi:hypothetical protein